MEINSDKQVQLLSQTITQPMDVIYSAMFEGDTTRQLPKITSFLVQLFGFLNFFGLFQLFEKLEKRIN